MGKKHKKQDKARKKERKAAERKVLSPAERFDALLAERWPAEDGGPSGAATSDAAGKPAKHKKHGKHTKHAASDKPVKAATASAAGKHGKHRAKHLGKPSVIEMPSASDGARTEADASVVQAPGCAEPVASERDAAECNAPAFGNRAPRREASAAHLDSTRPSAAGCPAALPAAVVRASLPAHAPQPAAFRTAAGAWDLHSHSVYSDGSRTPEELIAGAREAGLAALAITDHDSLKQLSAVRACARRLDFLVLAGTEVSARDYATGRNVHILAFGLEATPDGSGPLERIVDDTLYQRTANTLWQAWLLRRRGAEFSGRYISLDNVVETAGQSLGVYKQHVMESLTHRHHEDPDYQFFYQCQFKGESPANHDIHYPAAVDAVRAIREQGGVPVLAHPGQMNSWASLPELVRAGLLGIEAYHPDHGAVEEQLAFEAAARYGLFVTGGSDYHGKYGAPAALGEAFVMPEEAGEPVEELFRREQFLS